MMHDPLVLALLGTGFTFAATALGAASVFVVRKNTSPSAHKAMLGFAAGDDDCSFHLEPAAPGTGDGGRAGTE